MQHRYGSEGLAGTRVELSLLWRRVALLTMTSAFGNGADSLVPVLFELEGGQP